MCQKNLQGGRIPDSLRSISLGFNANNQDFVLRLRPEKLGRRSVIYLYRVQFSITYAKTVSVTLYANTNPIRRILT
jgi:hypothetical protein